MGPEAGEPGQRESAEPRDEPPFGQSGYGGQPGYGQQFTGDEQQFSYAPPSGYGWQPGYGQTGYQTGYGQSAPPGTDPYPRPATGTARTTRVGLWTALIVVLVLAVAAVVLFIVKPSPLFKKVLDHNAVEQTIRAQSQNGSGGYTGVSCPANEQVTPGTRFQCTASGGKKINVTVTSSEGNYTWSPAG